MKRVAVIQSSYIPWKGYFDIIRDVDLFLFYDDVQFTVRDWRNRNLIKTPNGKKWLTIPVGSNRNRMINEVGIENNDWQIEHWKTLNQFYSNARYFRHYEEELRSIYVDRQWDNLSALNQHFTKKIACEWLGIKTEFLQTSDLHVTTKRQDRILDILKAVDAEAYISGPSAKSYLDIEKFIEAGIDLIWKDYSGYPEYSQFYPPFDHAVTVLDLFFHVGPDAPNYIWGWRK